jgi:hypothetical protein
MGGDQRGGEKQPFQNRFAVKIKTAKLFGGQHGHDQGDRHCRKRIEGGGEQAEGNVEPMLHQVRKTSGIEPSRDQLRKEPA